MKRVLSILLVFVIVLGMAPVSSLATGDYVTTFRTNGNNNNYFEISINGSVLTVSGIYSTEYDDIRIKMYRVGNDTDLTKEDTVEIGQRYSGTFNLEPGENTRYIIRILGHKENADYDFGVPYIDYFDGEWGFAVNRTVYDYNKKMRSQWANPKDYTINYYHFVNEEVIAQSDSIVAGAKSDYEKVYLIYDWITKNIKYDYDYYNAKKLYTALDPSAILKTKLTVCEGYAYLMRALVNAQNIPCMFVTGNVLDDNEGHAWNEVWVEGRWIIVDATWSDFNITEYALSQDRKIISRGFIANQSIPSEWAQNEIAQAFSFYLIPYPLQGDYANNITRSDFCQLAVKLIESKNGTDIGKFLSDKGLSINTQAFSDCSDNNVQSAYALGIVGGRGNKIFDPNGQITRQEAAVMLQRTATILGVLSTNGTAATFADSDSFASWSTESIGFISALSDKTSGNLVMGGTGNGNFSPKSAYTRQQAYCTMLRLYNAI